MINHVALRHLAKAYFEGQVDRESYLQRRRELINSLSDESDDRDFRQRGGAHVPVGLSAQIQPDSSALANALTDRDIGVSSPLYLPFGKQESQPQEITYASSGQEVIPEKTDKKSSEEERGSAGSVFTRGASRERHNADVLRIVFLTITVIVIWYLWSIT